MDTPNAAIAQIKDREYPSILSDYSGDVLLVAITYDYSESANDNSKKHTCSIEKWEK